MIIIESLINELTQKEEFQHDGTVLLSTLSETVQNAQEPSKLELLQRIDKESDEKFPSGNLVDIINVRGAFPVSISYKEVEQEITFHIKSYIEDTSKTVQTIIPSLLSRSLLLFLHENKKNRNAITRRYIYTDQLQIYKLDLKVHYIKVPCVCLSEFADTLYLITGTKSTIDLERIDFPSLGHFYQRQLLAHGISRNELFHLYNELKDTYYRQKCPHMPFILR